MGPLPDQSTRTKCTRWMSAAGKPCSRATSGKGAGDQIASRMPSSLPIVISYTNSVVLMLGTTRHWAIRPGSRASLSVTTRHWAMAW